MIEDLYALIVGIETVAVSLSKEKLEKFADGSFNDLEYRIVSLKDNCEVLI